MRPTVVVILTLFTAGCATCPYGGRDARLAESDVVARAWSASRVYDIEPKKFHPPAVRYDRATCTWNLRFEGVEGYVGDWFDMKVQDYSGSTTFRAGY